MITCKNNDYVINENNISNAMPDTWFENEVFSCIMEYIHDKQTKILPHGIKAFPKVLPNLMLSHMVKISKFPSHSLLIMLDINILRDRNQRIKGSQGIFLGFKQQLQSSLVETTSLALSCCLYKVKTSLNWRTAWGDGDQLVTRWGLTLRVSDSQPSEQPTNNTVEAEKGAEAKPTVSKPTAVERTAADHQAKLPVDSNQEAAAEKEVKEVEKTTAAQQVRRRQQQQLPHNYEAIVKDPYQVSSKWSKLKQLIEQRGGKWKKGLVIVKDLVIRPCRVLNNFADEHRNNVLGPFIKAEMREVHM